MVCQTHSLISGAIIVVTCVTAPLQIISPVIPLVLVYVIYLFEAIRIRQESSRDKPVNRIPLFFPFPS